MSFVSFENVSKVYGSGLAQIKAVDGITFAIE